MDPLTYFLVWIATTVLSIALSPKPPKPKPAALSDFDIPTAEEGRPIPVIFGTVDITGANVLWYGDLKTKALKQSSLFGSTVIGYKYFIGLHFGLCHGPVNTVTRIAIGDKLAWAGSLTANGTASINAPTLFGGKKREGGVVGDVDFEFGGTSQSTNSYLSSKIGGTLSAHRGIFGAVFRNPDSLSGGYIGNSPYVKGFAFRVKRTTAGWHSNATWYSAKAEITGGGMNGAHILYECMTNPEWGMGISTALIDETSWTAAADKLYTENFGLSLIWNQQTTIEDFVQTILDHVAGVVVFRQDTGKFELRLVRGDYSTASLPVYNESNVLSVQKREVRGWGETVNEVTLIYTDPTTLKDTSITAQDLANIAIQGRVSTSINMPGIRNAALAETVVNRELAGRATPLTLLQIQVDRAAWNANQGDLFKFTWPKFGIADVVFRVLKIQKGTLTDNTITIDALEDIYSLGTGTYITQPGAPSDPSTTDEGATESSSSSVISTTTTTPPASPADGATYYVPTGATGAWSGQAGNLATWDADSGAWEFQDVSANTVVFDSTAGKYVTLNGTGGTTDAPWVQWVAAPATTGAAGTAGQVAYDANYFYVCTATNTWKRVGIATW